MNHLLILSVLAALPLVEGQEITRLTACTTKTNDLSLECQHKKASGDIKYEWSLFNRKNQTLVIISTIQENKADASYKKRAKVTKTDDMVMLNVTGFGTIDNGKYTCHLRLNAEPGHDDNKTISVTKETIPKCGASGLLLNIPLMLSLLLLLPVLQNLGNLPCGNEN
ncbi:thy-1 membrane glycoprotein-like [Amblyraja radiata]|uniref:thy-1 membrane glycoprotein-like n=1 Tax=Amblyraja radiata TaxID=386614 RepID=UPI0014032E7F|nr:thy-1 membrane glycoprotein-like [Amblyraja radiata]